MGRFRRASRRARPTRLFSGSPSSTFFPTPRGCPRTAVSTASCGRPGKRREGTCGARRRGTTGSSAPAPPSPRGLRPGGQGEEGGGEKGGGVDDENAAAMGGVAGHAGIFSSAYDLYLFAREILRARRGEGRVLNRRSAGGKTGPRPH